jgi:hypothetical protein
MKWTKPQLIVIARGTPEESVLQRCKAIDVPGIWIEAQEAGQTGCDEYDPGNCGACQDRGGGAS